ncbi:MAG: hypothetical protein WBF04_24525, partial [Candidatus Sulfotelmatobacter sp.]
GLPRKRGRGATLTHDYKRNGTATLFAALNAANGEVFGLCQERYIDRHNESPKPFIWTARAADESGLAGSLLSSTP